MPNQLSSLRSGAWGASLLALGAAFLTPTLMEMGRPTPAAPISVPQRPAETAASAGDPKPADKGSQPANQPATPKPAPLDVSLIQNVTQLETKGPFPDKANVVFEGIPLRNLGAEKIENLRLSVDLVTRQPDNRLANCSTKIEVTPAAPPDPTPTPETAGSAAISTDEPKGADSPTPTPTPTATAMPTPKAMPIADGAAKNGSVALTLAPNGMRAVNITLTGLPYAGEYKARVYAVATGYAPQSFTLVAHVRDFWVVPLVVLLGGVLLSSGAQYLVSKIRPRLQAQFRVADDEARLDALRPGAARPENLQSLDAIETLLKSARLNLSIDEDDTAFRRLDEAEVALNAFEGENNQRLRGLLDSVKQLTAKIEKALTDKKGNDEKTAAAEIMQLKQFRDELTRLNAMVVERRTDEADSGLKDLSNRLNDFLNPPLAGAALADAADADEPKPPTKQRLLEQIGQIEQLLFAVSSLVAVLTGMYLHYSGKNFGTGRDYLALLLWAFGVNTAVAGVFSLTQALGSLPALLRRSSADSAAPPATPL